MVEHETTALVEEYAKLGEYGRIGMAKKYPHIDFESLIADLKSVVVENNIVDDENSHKEYDWTKILETITYITFATALLGGGIFSLIIFSVGGFGGAFALFFFTVSVLGAFLLLAVLMVFIQMAKDISGTAKDTAEMKELLKLSKT